MLSHTYNLRRQVVSVWTNTTDDGQFELTGGGACEAGTEVCCHRRGINPWCSVYISLSPLLYTTPLCDAAQHILVDGLLLGWQMYFFKRQIVVLPMYFFKWQIVVLPMYFFKWHIIGEDEEPSEIHPSLMILFSFFSVNACNTIMFCRSLNCPIEFLSLIHISEPTRPY